MPRRLGRSCGCSSCSGSGAVRVNSWSSYVAMPSARRQPATGQPDNWPLPTRSSQQSCHARSAACRRLTCAARKRHCPRSPAARRAAPPGRGLHKCGAAMPDAWRSFRCRCMSAIEHLACLPGNCNPTPTIRTCSIVSRCALPVRQLLEGLQPVCDRAAHVHGQVVQLKHACRASGGKRDRASVIA